MGKKKRAHPDVEEILSRPWCYYCERDFDDQKVLINHQKAKHFKCDRCGRRLNTAGGLSVHMSQVHKETLSAVDNALPNRAGLDIEIFGMEGIPDDIIQQHNQRVLTQYHQTEAERRVATGNVGGAGGAAAGNQPKKPKFESPSDLKKRLAEHKAKLAAEQANGGSSGGGTPLGAGLSPAAPVMSPHYPQQQTQQQSQHFNGASGSAPFNFAPGYGQPSQPGPSLQPGGPLPQQSSFSPPPFSNQAPFPGSPFAPQMVQTGPPPFQAGPPGGSPANSSRPFGAGSPGPPFGFQQQQQQQQQQPPPQPQQQPRINTPPQSGPPPQRSLSGNLPPAPGLPQRPAFGAPHVNHFKMQQMHQGQLPAPPGLPVSQPAPGPNAQPNTVSQLPNAPPQNAQQAPVSETSLDDLISGASKQAEKVAAAALQATEVPQADERPSDKPSDKGADEEKKDRKEKSKPSHLVYSDQDTSPEEKMARMARYAFTPEMAR